VWRISVALDPVLADDGDQPHPSFVSDDVSNAGEPPTAESAIGAPSDGASAVARAAVATPADRRFPTSWGQQYLIDRFGEDITDDSRFHPG
jgi:hypothetical protein